MDTANRAIIPSFCARFGELASLLTSLLVGACYTGGPDGPTEISPGEELSATADASAGSTPDAQIGILAIDATYDVSVSLQVKGILDQTCAGSAEQSCHARGVENLALSYLQDFASIIDVPSTEMPDVMRVLPFDPDNSYLYRKLVCDGGITGLCMPYSTVPTDPQMIALFLEWIEAGAPLPTP